MSNDDLVKVAGRIAGRDCDECEWLYDEFADSEDFDEKADDPICDYCQRIINDAAYAIACVVEDALKESADAIEAKRDDHRFSMASAVALLRDKADAIRASTIALPR